jgi:hypothetical protein
MLGGSRDRAAIDHCGKGEQFVEGGFHSCAFLTDAGGKPNVWARVWMQFATMTSRSHKIRGLRAIQGVDARRELVQEQQNLQVSFPT